MPVRARDGGYQADFTHKGVRRREQFATMQEGLAWEADTKAALISGRPLPQARRDDTEGGEMTLTDLRKATIARYWVGTKNEIGASRNAQAAVDYFATVGVTTARQVTTAKAEGWVTALLAEGQSGATVNRKVASLTKMCRHAAKIGKRDGRLVVERCSEAEGRLRFLTQEEFDPFHRMFTQWGKEVEAALVLFLTHTGARITEALSVRKCDFHAAGQRLSKAPDRVMIGAGVTGAKSGEWRVVPLSAALQAIIPALLVGLGEKDQVFGSRINGWGFRSLYMRVRDHVGLGEDVVIHTLRHTCASWLVQRGVDIRRVQLWMGHKSLAMTLRYAKLAPNDLFAAAATFDHQTTDPLKEAA